MEAMFARHPDFGRGGVFAVVAAKCFQYDAEEVDCRTRLRWLVEHGYEVANYTWTHENLHTVSDERFMKEVGATKVWIDEHLQGESRGNLSNILVLPFGEWPRNDQQVLWMKNTFQYNGEEIRILAIVEVSGGAGPSPSSGNWDRRSVKRANTEPAVWDRMTTAFESGTKTFYTSDGNPDTITIPNEIPGDLADEFDPDWASAYDMQVVRYDAIPSTQPSEPGPEIDPATPGAPAEPTVAARSSFRRRPSRIAPT